MRKLIIAAAALPLAFALGACDSGTDSSTATQNDQAVTNSQLLRYQKNQPVPAFDWSQYRQTIIDVEQAQVHGTATTSFFFNLGTPNPIKSCPSIGFPVATTAQLTNPDQVELHQGNYNGGNVVISQQEPNGVYTGDSSGTYVVCVSKSGQKYVTYWEGDVQTEGGAAHWDRSQGQIVLDGEPTVKAKSR